VTAYRQAVVIIPAPQIVTTPELIGHDVRADALRLVEQAASESQGLAPDVEITTEAVEGSPVDVLLEQGETAGLLVLGSRQLHALGSFLFGSVGHAVAARSSCPTVIVRGRSGEEFDGGDILVGIGPADRTHAALSFAFAEATRHGVGLHALRIGNTPLWPSESLKDEYVERSWEQENAELADLVSGWQRKYPDVKATSELTHGHPAAMLAARSAGKSLVVVGNHPHAPLVGGIFGSVSQAVVHHASCPVAVVPVKVA
jgi:nucleotide-binding universal stress UspA family protein